jgi:homoserine kinase
VIRALAPASTANLGPGFDAAAAALDLWNEVEVEDGAFAVEIDGEGAVELPHDATHLTLRAFAAFAPPEERSFHFVNRIPLERGLGSSAAAIALGLVAGAAAVGRESSPTELLAVGELLEGHADNLAAALHGGVCLAWRRNGSTHAARIAAAMPASAVLVVPESRTSTAASRGGLPPIVRHEDAAVTAGAAALLGAAIASGDGELLGEAFADRLHEPYRLDSAPLLQAARDRLPDGAHGVTLSGSGPSVVVWARPERAADVAAELERAFPDATILPLEVAPEGAHTT